MFLDKFLIFNLDAGTDPVSFLLEKKKKKIQQNGHILISLLMLTKEQDYLKW